MPSLLQSLSIVFGTAAFTTFLFERLKQPVILGYILAGMIIGPHIPVPLVADEKIIHALSELGVIFLMYSMGLKFNIQKWIKTFPTAGLITLIQCGLMIWLGYVTGRAFGWSVMESVYVGCAVSISSTTIIAKVFSDLNIKDKMAETVFGILIIEDIVAILMLATLTPLSYGETLTGLAIAKHVGMLFMFLLTLVLGGLFFVPRVLPFVLRLNKPETTLMAGLALCLTFSLMAKAMGYSVALGAFLAGSLVAESGSESRIVPLFRPIRDLFAAVFFVSVGMMIDPILIKEHFKEIVVLSLVVILGKWLGVTVGAFFAGHGVRQSVRTGLSLSQIGEFSFIIISLGLATKSAREFLYPVIVAVSVVTTLLTPWMVKFSDRIALAIDHRLPGPLQTFAGLYETWAQNIRFKPANPSQLKRLIRVILIDFVFIAGIFIAVSLSIDKMSLHMIRWFELPVGLTYAILYTVGGLVLIPFGIGIIRSARSLGLVLATRALPLSSPDKLDLAAAPRRSLVVALQLAVILLIGLPLLAITQPFYTSFYGAFILVGILIVLGVLFWNSTVNLQGHVRAGAELMLENLNASVSQATPFPSSHLLPGLGSMCSISLSPTSPAAGHTLSELNLRGETGASVLAISRNKEGVVIPTGREKLKEGDVLALTGTPEAITAAKIFLLEGTTLHRKDTR